MADALLADQCDQLMGVQPLRLVGHDQLRAGDQAGENIHQRSVEPQ